jgi:hypothetical protein
MFILTVRDLTLLPHPTFVTTVYDGYKTILTVTCAHRKDKKNRDRKKKACYIRSDCFLLEILFGGVDSDGSVMSSVPG